MARAATQNNNPDVDMTPMLDIVFIMLIFFIVTTSFVRETGMEVFRPQESHIPPPTDTPSLSVLVTNNGQIYMNGRLVDIERVNANVQNFLAENQVNNASVKAEPKASHGIVVRVLDQMSEAGIERLAVAVSKD